MKYLVTSLLVLAAVLATLDLARSEQHGKKGHGHKGHGKHGRHRQHAHNQDLPPTFKDQLARYSQSTALSAPQMSSVSLSELSQHDTSLSYEPQSGPGAKKCASCVDRELFKNFTREEIRDKILRKLGMASAPNVTAEAVPEHLIKQLVKRYRHEFEMQNDEASAGGASADGLDEEDDYHFQTKQINILSKTPDQHEVPTRHQNWDIEYFHVATDQLKDAWRQVTKAHVWVHLPGAPSPEDEHAWIDLYYVSVDKNDHAFLTQEKATKVTLRPDRGGWVEINVWDVVSLWFKNPDMNLGINLEARTSNGKKIDIGVKAQPSLAPFLQLDIQDSSANYRRKRTLNKVCSEAEDSAEKRCCLWPFTVDFEKEFGWKWIVYPPKYEANFCSGDCSLGVMMPSNPWAHLLQQANGNPCCAPQKMSGINMLYLDANKNVILGKLPNMKVDRCGCA